MKRKNVTFRADEFHLATNLKYGTKNPISRRLLQGFFRRLAMLAQANSANIVLDVGCGEGIPLSILHNLYPKAKLYGIDVDNKLLQAAPNNSPGFYVQASAYTLPYPDRFFDLVICLEVLEHLDEPAAALAEIVRVGRGKFIFSVPNEPIWRLANLARGSYWQHLGNTPGHINHWSAGSFTRFVADYLTVEGVYSPFPWTMISAKMRL